jgi:DNA-binding winged helix-turn-helix (wHTH) protein
VTGTFRVGEWLVAPQLNRVECNGHSVHLEPKVMEVLVCLCQAKGEPVSKEHLFRQVWQDTFVTDDVLKRCIWQLRKAFRDDSKNPTVIETIAKGGYRLLLPVEAVETDAQGAARELQILSEARNTRRLIGGALVVVAIERLSNCVVRTRPKPLKFSAPRHLASWESPHLLITLRPFIRFICAEKPTWFCIARRKRRLSFRNFLITGVRSRIPPLLPWRCFNSLARMRWQATASTLRTCTKAFSPCGSMPIPDSEY